MAIRHVDLPDDSQFGKLLKQHPFGFYADPETLRPWPDDQPVIKSEWLRDGRNMRLLAPAVFVDTHGKQWHAGEGRIVNGLSSPRFFWRIQPPFVGKARDASVFHDIACEDQTEDSELVHWMFWLAMRASGVGPREAFWRWFGVILRGPRFKGATR